MQGRVSKTWRPNRKGSRLESKKHSGKSRYLNAQQNRTKPALRRNGGTCFSSGLLGGRQKEAPALIREAESPKSCGGIKCGVGEPGRGQNGTRRLGCPDRFYYVNLNSLEREKERNKKVEGSHGAFSFLILKKFVRISHTWATNKSTFIAVIKKK